VIPEGTEFSAAQQRSLRQWLAPFSREPDEAFSLGDDGVLLVWRHGEREVGIAFGLDLRGHVVRREGGRIVLLRPYLNDAYAHAAWLAAP